MMQRMGTFGYTCR